MLPWGTCDSKVTKEPFKDQSFGGSVNAYIRQTSCMRVRRCMQRRRWGGEGERTGNGAV